eukprot:scaffold93016_cov66-Phaeocystis_antarctica.AAC.5
MQNPPVGPECARGICAQYSCSADSQPAHGSRSAVAVRHQKAPSCSRCAFCRRKAAAIAAGSAPKCCSLRTAKYTARARPTRIAAACALTSSACCAAAVNGSRSQRRDVMGEHVQLFPHGRRAGLVVWRRVNWERTAPGAAATTSIQSNRLSLAR